MTLERVADMTGIRSIVGSDRALAVMAVRTIKARRDAKMIRPRPKWSDSGPYTSMAIP